MAKVKKVADSHLCQLCKEELDLGTKLLDAAIIKQQRVSSLVKELEAKGEADIEEKVKQKLGIKERQYPEGLGIEDIVADAVEVISDAEELRKVFPPPHEAVDMVAGKAFKRGKDKRPRFLPPLPHEILG